MFGDISSFLINNTFDWISPVLFLLAIFLGIFLFWRAGRHELIDSVEILDTVVVSLLGFLITGRIVDFLTRVEFYHWSIQRLMFFNVFWGFDYYGGIFGLFAFSLIYLKFKKTNILKIFDLAATPLIFIQVVYYLGKLISFKPIFGKLSISLFTLSISIPLPKKDLTYLIFYFFIFFVLSRLSVKKRHAGFFISFYLVAVALLNLLIRVIFVGFSIPLGQGMWHLIFDLTFLFFGLMLWYVLGKRKIKEDLKAAFAYLLLAIFRTKRMIASQNEAGKFAKLVLFTPFNLVRSFLLFVRFIILQIYLGFLEFVNVFRAKK